MEILIWIIIVAQIFQNLDNWINYVAYAGGFATGTYVGMVIEERMKVGIQIYRIITGKKSNVLAEKLLEADFRVTTVDAKEKYGEVKILFTIAKWKRWQELSELIRKHAPNAFYSVEDVKHTSSIEDESLPNKQDLMTRMLKMKKGI